MPGSCSAARRHVAVEPRLASAPAHAHVVPAAEGRCSGLSQHVAERRRPDGSSATASISGATAAPGAGADAPVEPGRALHPKGAGAGTATLAHGDDDLLVEVDVGDLEVCGSDRRMPVS